MVRARRSRSSAPTIRDVAAHAGVSIATVSNVLSGTRYVGPERRERVEAAIDALGYRPNGIAASLRSRRSRIIGIVVPDFTNAFFGGLVKRIEELAADSGYEIILVSSNEDPALERQRIGALLSRQVEAMIVVPAGDDFLSMDDLRLEGVPAVILDRAGSLAEVDTISADNEAATHEGTRHLLHLGHRDIALLVSSLDLENIREREAGYRRALEEAGLSPRARVVHGGLTVDSARQAAIGALSGADRPSALFAATHVAALGAIQAIRELDLSFPEEISLLGFDDFEWMTVLKPFISTIRQPTEKMGDLAWSLMTKRLAGEMQEHARIRLPCTLCVRESTIPAGKGV
ncbi:MAG: LacI family DNA-binding transcriptional regulator [Azospirillaceae bacterium]